VVGWQRSSQVVSTDVVILPVDRIMHTVRSRIAPVAIETPALIGTTRSGKGEQITRYKNGSLARERLRLGDSQ